MYTIFLLLFFYNFMRFIFFFALRFPPSPHQFHVLYAPKRDQTTPPANNSATRLYRMRTDL